MHKEERPAEDTAGNSEKNRAKEPEKNSVKEPKKDTVKEPEREAEKESGGSTGKKKRSDKGRTDETLLAKKPRKKIRKRIIIAAVIVILIVINIVSRMLKPETLPTVSGAYAQRGDVEETLDTSGYVSSEVEQTVFSPVTAYVAASHVEEGQPVNTGEELIQFELDTLEKAAEQAKLTKDASVYGYQDRLGKANKNDQDLTNANTSIGILEQQIADQKDYIANIQEDIQNKQREVQQSVGNQTAPIEARNIEIDVRIDQLESEIAIGTQAGQDVTAQSTELNALYAEKTENEKQLAALTATAAADTSAQEAALADAQEQLAEWQADLAEYEGQKSSAEAGQMSGSERAQIATSQKLETLTASTAEETLEKAKAGIWADMNGVVTEISIVDGAPVTEGAALFKISSMDDVKVDISVTKYNLESIQVGQKADITVAGSDYEGTVTKIDKIATKNDSGTPVVGAQIHIDNPDEKLYLGVEARISVHMDKSENAVLVPVEAVNTGIEGDFCWVLNSEGQVERRNVETGVSSSDYTEIVSGISEGEFVISDASASSLEGMKVSPVDASVQ